MQAARFMEEKLLVEEESTRLRVLNKELKQRVKFLKRNLNDARFENRMHEKSISLKEKLQRSPEQKLA